MEHVLELARARKLDKVGATYAVVAWLVVQAASIAFPAFEVAPWGLRWLIVLLVIGFPIALAVAWAAGGRSETATLTPLGGRDLLLFGLIGVIAVLVVVQVALGLTWYRAKNASSDIQAASIAVLPFDNLSGDASKVYFSDGIADQLISELSRTPSLRVAARTSSFAFRGKGEDVKTIARKLGVRTILEGSVREAGDRVRIVAELVDATNGFQIWSESYDRNLTNILSLQDEIARAISGALSQHFFGKAIVSRGAVPAKAINPEAYKAYLQGQFYFAQRTREGIARAIHLFEQATALAPDYAEGFAALADARSANALDFALASDIAPAQAAVEKALSLDPNNVTALLARSRVSLLRWKWRAVAADLRHLERLHLNSAAAWRTRAVFYDYMGLAQYAGPAEDKAVQLDPLSFIDHYNLALYHMVAKDFATARRIAADAAALLPGHPDLLVLQCQIAIGQNHLDEADRIEKQLIAQAGTAGSSPYVAACGFFLAVARKDFASARKVADAVAKLFPASGITATDIGMAYGLTDDVDDAITWFRRALDLREPVFPRVPYSNPELEKVFADPRWKALRADPAIRDWETARAEVVTTLKRTNS